MLSETERTLILTAVDGELTPNETAAFRLLLGDSAEAVRYFDVVSRQAQQLRTLRKHPAPAGIAEHVIASISSGNGRSIERADLPRRYSNRLPYAVAASALVAVTAGSFWLASSERTKAVSQDVAKIVRPSNASTDSSGTPLLPLTSDGSAEMIVLPEEVAGNPVPSESLPTPRPATRTAVTALPSVFGATPFPPTANLTEVQLRLPTLLAVSRLQEPEATSQVAKLWETQRTVKLELFVREPSKVVELLKAGLAAFQVNVAVDEATQERLRKSPTLPCVLFCDVLTAEELRTYLTWLGKRSESEGISAKSMLHAQESGVQDAKDLRELFGSDFGWAGRKKPFESKSNPTPTVEELTKQLQAKKRQALLGTYLPAAIRLPQANASEVKQFSAAHDDRKPDAVGFLLLVRPTS